MPKKWKREDITPEVLRQLLHLDEETGKLYWKERGPEWFSGSGKRTAEHAQKIFNSRDAGKEVGVRNIRGHELFRILGENWVSLNRAIYEIKTGVKLEDNQYLYEGVVMFKNDVCSIKKLGTNSTGYMGVTYHEKLNKWRVRVSGNSIGLFPTPIEAARAYDKAAFEKWGEHARLNFPEEYGLAPKETEIPEDYFADTP